MTVAAVSIGRLDGFSAHHGEDLVAVEEPLEIRVGGESLTITMRTPGNDDELATRVLFSEGITKDHGGIRSIGRPVDGNPSVVEITLSEGMDAAFVTTSACGLWGKSSLSGVTGRRGTHRSPGWYMACPGAFEIHRRI